MIDEAREALFKSACMGMGTQLDTPRGGVIFPAPIDICEHLPLLRELASKCDHVTEMGSRWMNGSTIALLAGQPKTLISWDIDPRSIVSDRTAVLMELKGKTNFQPRVGSTLEINTEETDLLFIDTLHTAKQLKAELERHSFVPNTWPPKPTVRKFLVFHDTTTFGHQGEDGSTPGLRAVIKWFQEKHALPLWRLVKDAENCNGLVVLARCDVAEKDFPK